MSRAVSQSADLCEQLQVDLHAMRILAGLDAAKYVSFFIFVTMHLVEKGIEELITDYPSFFFI